MPKRPKSFNPTRAYKVPIPTDRAKVERDSFYTSSRWKKLRAQKLRASPLCAHCLARDVLTPATVVHHKLERLQHPDAALDFDQLESLCNPCHTRLHKATPGGASEG